jgi:hypothetical protein
LYAFLFSFMRATCPAYLIVLGFIIIFGEENTLWQSSVCNFLQSPIISPPLGPNILLNTLSSNTLSLYSSLNVRYKVSRRYETTGKIVILCI